MNIKTVKELIYFFRPEREVRPIFLIGAGGSFRAGVPVAAEMVRQIARYSFAINKLGVVPEHATGIMEGDIQSFLRKKPWFKEGGLSELFTFAVENLLTPKVVRKEFFASILNRAKSPTEGHEALADLVQRQLVQTILTTNFDSLIEDALRAKQPQLKQIVTINKAAGDIAAFSPHNHAQIVYLHGAFEYYRDRNSINETKRLDEDIVSRVRPMVSYAPLIIVGYRGYEPSIMHHLIGEGVDESNQYAHGIFWCARNRHDLHENVIELSRKVGSNFSLVQIDGFDEMMIELNSQLAGLAGFQGSATARVTEVKENSKNFDLEICPDLTLDDLEQDQLLAMCVRYAETILKAELKTEKLERFLESSEFARRDAEGKLRPTRGLYLLTGRDVTERYPHLKTIVLRDGKHQTVFPGNLLKQFDDLREFLLSPEINPTVRIKRPDGAVEMKSYHDRAILELLVNLMAHRDYRSETLAQIEYQRGETIRFFTPGGLPDRVHKVLKPDKASGSFSPKRDIREIRNPVIADVFFSRGIMDKAGTGMVDTMALMEEHYGATTFSVGPSNEYVEATLIQARAVGEMNSHTAVPVRNVETFVTNLFPFLVIPENVFILPLDSEYQGPKSKLFFPNEDDPAKSIIFVRSGGSLISFCDFSNFQSFARRVGFLDYQSTESTKSFINDTDKRRIFVQLLGRHWEAHLKTKSSHGFYVDYIARRAYFVARNGGDNVFVYDSPQRRNIKRGVVKKRESPGRIDFENEGITYSIVQFGERWAVQTKPFYIFTGADGKTPLPGMQQTRKATRRYKFDRNKAVESDMKFWSVFLADKKPTMDLGVPILSSLILSANYLEADVLAL